MHRPCFAVVGALILASCATGPTLQETRASIPELAVGKARLFFYRAASPIAWGIQPSVMLNNEKIGDSVPGGVFYCDVKPGNYVVSATTEVEKSAPIMAVEGRQHYIRMGWGVGWIVARVNFEPVPEAVGEAEVQTLSVLAKTSCPPA